VEKQLFYRTDLHKLYIYNGSTWVDCTSQGTTVHNDLTGRDAADCHPLSAITGLSAHASRHQSGGADVINVTGLSGELADRQKSKVGDSTLGWTLNTILKGAGGGVAPTQEKIGIYCIVSRTSAFSVPDNTETVVPFDSELFDTDNIHDNSTNNSRLTCQTSGLYLVYFYVGFDVNTTGHRMIRVKANINSTWVNIQQFRMASIYSYTMFGSAAIAPFSTGDYVTLIAYQNSGGALNLLATEDSPRFGMVKIL
jgi:hypothetical protein